MKMEIAEEELRILPIAYVRHQFAEEEVRESLRGVCGEIVLSPEYRDGLRGLEGFSHLIIIAYLHKVAERQRNTLLVRPRKLVKLGVPYEQLPEVGVFATDSPHRPNPLALTIVSVRDIKEGVIEVCGLDLFDGTPILDIKPYTPSRAVSNISVPAWYKRLLDKLSELGITDVDI